MDSLTWYFNITILFALNSCKKKSMFTFFEVVNFADWVSYIVFAVSFDLIFFVSFLITIFEPLPLSNIIRKLLYFTLPLRVFIQPYRIDEQWLFLVLARFVGFKKLDGTLHSRLILLFYIYFAIWPSLHCAGSNLDSLSDSTAGSPRLSRSIP